jgi:hypothetical protein
MADIGMVYIENQLVFSNSYDNYWIFFSFVPSFEGTGF